jgi:fumarate reductase iron-sulfur subunit
VTQAKEADLHVWRGDGNGGGLVRYAVPLRDSQTVLDAVTWIQRRLEPGLSFRFACRVGMCGTCAMTVNGTPRWTCRTRLKDVVENGRVVIAPLENLPIIKDLACDFSGFFGKWGKAGGTFASTATRQDAVAAIRPDSRRRRLADAGIECINCGVCYSACDVVRWNPAYLGPAALNRSWTLVNDERDGGREKRLRAVAGDGGCHTCHSHQGCATLCPKELNPTLSIAGLKRATALAVLKGEM